MIEELDIPSGPYQLAGRIHHPQEAGAAVYVLHPAVGVPRDYYAAFADWVAEQGHAILTYDYRGDGPGHLRRSRIRLQDWGVEDQNAALNALAARFPGAELRVIGHSLGGFMTMFHDRAGEVARLVAICSGPAYWRRTPMPQKVQAFLFWYLLGPAAAGAMGYLPARLLGGSVDLPKPVFAQWRQWCTNPDLHQPWWGKDLPMPRRDGFQGDLRLVGVADDWMIPVDVVHDLARFYPGARVTRAAVQPQGRAIGHISVFRPRNAAHWPGLI